MTSVLIELGPVVVTTQSLFLTLSFLTTAFIFWRKTREEHYQPEQAFDAFLLASVVGLATGRIGFMVLHFNELGSNLWNWLDVISHPGSSILFGFLGASLYLYRYAGQQKWDQFEILDFWFLSVAAGMVLKQVGNFLAGVNFGYETNLPWGIVFPGVLTKHHPTQLYAALFFLGLYLYLSWAEYHYRTFLWYRAGKKTAQTGYLTSVFLIGTGAFMVLLQAVKPALLVVQGLSIDLVAYVVMFLGGSLMLYLKSGRTFSLRRKKK